MADQYCSGWQPWLFYDFKLAPQEWIATLQQMTKTTIPQSANLSVVGLLGTFKNHSISAIKKGSCATMKNSLCEKNKTAATAHLDSHPRQIFVGYHWANIWSMCLSCCYILLNLSTVFFFCLIITTGQKYINNVTPPCKYAARPYKNKHINAIRCACKLQMVLAEKQKRESEKAFNSYLKYSRFLKPQINLEAHWIRIFIL